MGSVDNEVQNINDEQQNIRIFRINFLRRYDSVLGFQDTTFQETINNVLDCPIEERGILALYLHDDNHVAVNIFAGRITIAGVTEYLNDRFINWGFDCTENNAEYMQRLLTVNRIYYDLSGFNSLPVLLIVSRFNQINEIISAITVYTQNIRQVLENCYEEFLMRRN